MHTNFYEGWADKENVEEAIKVIENLVKDVEIGEEFEGRITRIEPYGMFVEIKPGKIGLLHASKMGEEMKTFAKKYNVGDKVRVVIISIDDLGRVQLKKAGVEFNSSPTPSRHNKVRKLQNRKGTRRS